MPGKSVSVKDLSDKQLENLVKSYESPDYKKGMRKSTAMLVGSSAGIGLGSGILTDHVIPGLLIGAGTGATISAYGYHRNKKLVKEAKEELKNRQNKQ